VSGGGGSRRNLPPQSGGGVALLLFCTAQNVRNEVLSNYKLTRIPPEPLLCTLIWNCKIQSN
jgi:hypothetical protein